MSFIRSSSRILLHFHSPTIPESEQPLCPTCKYYGLRSIRLSELSTIVKTTECALCRAVTNAMSPVLTQSVLDYAEHKENTLCVILRPSNTDTALEIFLWNFEPDGAFKDIEESISWELMPFRPLLHVDLDCLHKSELFSSAERQPITHLCRINGHITSVSLM